MELESMSRTQLRAACKDSGIQYAKLTVAGMRAALALVVNGDTKPAIDEVTKPTAKKAPDPRTPPVEQYGVRAPIKGVCADVWTACDDWLTTNGTAPKVADLRNLAEKRKWNRNNLSIEVSRWRRFHGHTKPKK